MTISFTLNLRTESLLNLREHFRKTAQRKKVHRETAFYATREALGSMKALAGKRFHVVMTRIAPRAFDDDNLAGSFKHIRDGIAQALDVNDGDKSRVTWRPEQEKGGKGVYAVRVEIEISDAMATV